MGVGWHLARVWRWCRQVGAAVRAWARWASRRQAGVLDTAVVTRPWGDAQSRVHARRSLVQAW